MCYLDSPRVVRLLGVCSTRQPAMIVEEFLANGNLHTFLAKVSASVQTRGSCGVSMRVRLQLRVFASRFVSGYPPC